MSQELLDKLCPECDNHPSNYRLKRDAVTKRLKVYYVPTNSYVAFFDGYDNWKRIIDYLLENGVEIEEESLSE